MKLDHYLITRFNLAINGWKTDPNHLVRDDWLSYRFGLFKKYTLPSIINQSNKNFKYVVMFHSLTPKKYIKLFKNIDVVYQIIYVNQPEYRLKLSEFIEIDTDKETIITSALDSDDILDKKYIEVIQASSVGRKNTLIEIPFGYLYNIFSKTIWGYFRERNQFVNLVESKRPFKTCYYSGHKKIWSLIPSIKILRTSWVYIEHILNDSGKNISIDLMNKLIPVEEDAKKLLEKYGISR